MDTTETKTAKPTNIPASQLAAWRERMGFSQTDACEALGCSRPAYSGWEKGTQPIPRYIGLACSALALGAYAE